LLNDKLAIEILTSTLAESPSEIETNLNNLKTLLPLNSETKKGVLGDWYCPTLYAIDEGYSLLASGNAIKLEIDDYVNQSLEKKGISRVMGKKSDLTLLNKIQVKALLDGNVNYLRNEMKERADTGKTKDIEPKTSVNSKVEKPSINDIEKVREVIISIIEHSDVIMIASKNKGGKNITEALQIFEENNWTSIIEEEFGVKYAVIKYLYTTGIIKSEWINLLHG
jgi:hypothetical protein